MWFKYWHSFASLSSSSSAITVASYSRNGSRFSVGVVPREVRLIVELNVGSAELFRGVCIPEGVELPLMFRLGSKSIRISDCSFNS